MPAVILNPKTGVFVSPKLISKYEEQGYTILHCESLQRTEYYSNVCLDIKWITVSKSTVLVNRRTKEKLELLHAINIPIDPEKYWYKYDGECIRFTLIYPQIPSDWSYFDFVGDPNDITEIPVGHRAKGWLVRNIERNHTGIYRLDSL